MLVCLMKNLSLFKERIKEDDQKTFGGISRKFNEKVLFFSRYGNRGNPELVVPTRRSTIMKLNIEKLALFCLRKTKII